MLRSIHTLFQRGAAFSSTLTQREGAREICEWMRDSRLQNQSEYASAEQLHLFHWFEHIASDPAYTPSTHHIIHIHSLTHNTAATRSRNFDRRLFSYSNRIRFAGEFPHIEHILHIDFCLHPIACNFLLATYQTFHSYFWLIFADIRTDFHSNFKRTQPTPFLNFNEFRMSFVCTSHPSIDFLSLLATTHFRWAYHMYVSSASANLHHTILKVGFSLTSSSSFTFWFFLAFFGFVEHIRLAHWLFSFSFSMKWNRFAPKQTRK